MISDPRTTPDSRLGRLLFALAVAALAHYLAFFMQMRPALYVALIVLSPVTLLLDRLLPAQKFAWSSNRPGSCLDDAKRPFSFARRVSRWLPLARSLRSRSRRPAPSAVSTSPKPTPRCSTSRRKWCWRATVSRPPSPWRATMKASRRNSRLVVPVPTFIERNQISVVEPATVDHLDAYTAPRLVEYYDPDPCAPQMVAALPAAPMNAAGKSRGARRARLSRRQDRGQVRCRRIRRLDPLGRGKRRADRLAQRQRLQDSGRRRARGRQLSSNKRCASSSPR